MLKNKFGMLKVLALALSVLMLVSLAACGNNGVAKEDMDSAIAAALAEQSKAEASKQAALESSLAAAQAAAESERKAAESSLAAAAAEASKAAAEASKAAASAEKKASEEASKAAAEASKAAASASKALEEATRTTTTKATETTAPIVKDDLTAVQIKFAEKKHEYLVTKASYYLASDYAELALLFDKAAIELQNALTVAAAENVLVTLDAEVADIKNALTDAAAVQNLIAGLGDVETEVVTTAYDKMVEAYDALYQLLYDYEDLFETKFEDKDDKKVTEIESWDEDAVKAIGIDYKALVKADAKIDVLKAYVKAGLRNRIATLYYTMEFEDNFDEDGDELFNADGSEADCYDVIAEGYYLYLVLAAVNGGDVAEADLPIDWEYLRDDEGDKIEQADLTEKPNATQYYHPSTGLPYAAGEDIYDEDAPTEWFTAEQFMEIFATPYVNAELQKTIDAAVLALEEQLDPKSGAAAAFTEIMKLVDSDLITPDETNPKVTYIASEKDAELDDIFSDFEDAMEALTFVGNYKGNATLIDAQIDVWTQYIEAYIAAGNAIVNASKVVAEETVLEWYEGEVDYYNDYYEEKTGATAVANLAAKLENLAAKKDAYLANIEAAPNYVYADLFDLELIEDYAAQNGYDEEIVDWDLADLLTKNGPDAKLYAYINAVIADAMNDNFATTSKSTGTDQVGVLADLVEALTDDLLALRDRLDPTNKKADLYLDNKGKIVTSLKETAELEGYVNDEYWSNIPKFLDLMAKIDATIEAMAAIDETTYTDKEETLKVPDAKATYGDKNRKQNLYWASQTAKDIAYAEYDEQDKLEKAVNEWLMNEVNYLVEKEGVKAEKISKITNGDMVTLTNTGLPITFVYTATEQACMAARDLYHTLYTEIHAEIMSMNGVVDAYKSEIADIVKKVTDVTSTNADLKAEVTAFGDLYKGYGDTYTALTWAFSDAGVESGYVNAFKKDNTLLATHITNKTDDVKSNAVKYLKAVDGDTTVNVQDDVDEYLAVFKATFGTNAASSTILALDQYRNEMVAKLEGIRNQYKNEYSVDKVLNGIVFEDVYTKLEAGKAADGKGYGIAYDPTEDKKSSTKGLAYEAQVDALFDSYIAKIKAVKLNTIAEVKDQSGDKILVKYEYKKLPIGDTTYELKTVTFNLAAAKELIDAYVVDLVGITVANGLGVDETDTPVKDFTGAVNKDGTSTYDLYNTSDDSRIKKAWNVYYNGVYN